MIYGSSPKNIVRKLWPEYVHLSGFVIQYQYIVQNLKSFCRVIANTLNSFFWAFTTILDFRIDAINERNQFTAISAK